MMIPWSALMTRAFTISIKAAAWIRTRDLLLLVQWPVSSTKGIMWSFCAKNFWCKTLTKQDYEPGDQRLSMYHLISNSTKIIIDFLLYCYISAFYWCMKIYWLCFDFGSGLLITFLGLYFIVPNPYIKNGFFIIILWSAIMTQAFTISIKAAMWIRTWYLSLLVQWPVSSTKEKMWSVCVKNFWYKTLTKQDYEPGDQRLSMYHLISNSTKIIIDFLLYCYISAFYWCMKIYWLCFDFGYGLLFLLVVGAKC